MSWGVATQNGVSVSLASIVSLSCGATEFSPASLFTSGVAGAWYDPSDYSTLFQDSAGTTPVTAVEQPVGLMLDKSQGGLGSELVTNGGFSSSSNWTLSSTTITGGNLVFGVAFGYASQAISGTAGTYKLLVNKSVGFAGAGNLTFAFYNAGSIVGSAISIGSATLTFGSGIITASGSFDEIRIVCSTTDAYQVDSVSVARAPGNHASQATSASRPILRARYNLLTYSEQFDNAAWSKGNSTIGSTPVLAPDGTTTADLLYPASSGASRGVYQRPTLSSGIFVTTIYAKVAGKSWVAFVDYGGGAACAWANLSTGAVGTVNAGFSLSVTAAQNGWYRLQFTQTAAALNPYIWLTIVDADNTGTVTANGTDGIYVWGGDLRTGSSAGTYQRIAAATDYATAGFLPYLYFVTDDSFGTNSIDFTATDKMSVCAGLTKLSDAATAMLVELSADSNANNGSFYLAAPITVGAAYRLQIGGTSRLSLDTAAYAAPVTQVITAANNIATPIATVTVNKTTSVSTPGSQGTGNFGNYPLFIGRRNNASLPLNGNIYQLIVCGKTLSASELASTEAYVATKTGVTI